MYEELKRKLEENSKCELTDEEIKMLYGIDYDFDFSLAEKHLNERDCYNDLLRIFDAKEIARTPEEITASTVVYLCNLYLNSQLPVYNIRYIYGDLDGNRTYCENFDNLEKVFGIIYFSLSLFDNLEYSFNMDKEQIKKEVGYEPEILKFSTDDMKDDEEIITFAVSKSGYCLEYASDRLKDNKEIVMKAVKKSGDSIKYASKNLQYDHDIVVAALGSSATSVYCIDEKFLADKNVILEAVKTNYRLLDKLPQYKEDSEIALAALNDYPGYLQEIQLHNDKDFILGLIELFVNKKGKNFSISNPLSYSFLDDDTNIDIIFEVIKKYPVAFTFIYNNIQRDRNYVFKAVQVNGLVLEYVLDEFKDDREIVLEAVKQNGLALSFVNSIYGDDDEIANEAVKQNPEAIEYVSDRIKESISNNKVK